MSRIVVTLEKPLARGKQFKTDFVWSFFCQGHQAWHEHPGFMSYHQGDSRRNRRRGWIMLFECAYHGCSAVHSAESRNLSGVLAQLYPFATEILLQQPGRADRIVKPPT